MASCGSWNRVVVDVDTYMSEEPIASIFKVEVVRVRIWQGDETQAIQDRGERREELTSTLQMG